MMTNRPFRPFDFDRDIKAVQRIWIECGWIQDEKDDREAVSVFFKTGEAEVATIHDEVECATHWTPGTVRYQDETLKLGAVTAVTTSHIARKLGFARELTARSLALQKHAGMHVSALGIFDQGFYNQLGYGNGPYETRVQFDPARLKVNAPFRPPQRLTQSHFKEIHHAMANRKMYHGGVVLDSPENTKAELIWTDKPFGLGYFDGPEGSLSHFIWGEMKDESGPYRITMRAYRTNEQLMELLALIKSLGDQIDSFKMLEFGEFQLQDILDQPFRTERTTRGSEYHQHLSAFAYWQFRILDLENCLAKTHLNGPAMKFNLLLTDPLNDILAGESTWQGLTGNYVITLGEESSASQGTDKNLPSLNASINAFSRLWFGVRPASNIAITDDLSGDPKLIAALDQILRLPKPHFGWDF
jgi:predicted acetyltransferase